MDTSSVATRQVFETLAESLEEGEPLPAEVLITYLRHPEAAIRALATKLLQHRPQSVHGVLSATGGPFGLPEDSDLTVQQAAQRLTTLLAAVERRTDELHC